MRRDNNSLLFKLLLSFLFIILIFSVLQILTFRYFTNTVDQSITQNTSASLDYDFEKFVSVLTDIRNSMLLLNTEDELKDFYSSYGSYYYVNCIKRINNTLSKNSQYIYDIFVYSENIDYIITADGSYNKNRFFEIEYSDAVFGPSLWENLKKDNFVFKYLKSTIFDRKNLNIAGNHYLMPLVFKPEKNRNIYIVAMIDIMKVLQATSHDSQDNVYIYNGNNLLYPENALYKPMDINSGDAAGQYKKDNYYVFVRCSDPLGLKYIKLLDYKSIKNKTKDINMIFMLAIVLSIMISFVISIGFSLRVNNPIRRIVDAINKEHPFTDLKSKISELNIISNKIQELVNYNKDFSMKLNERDSLLKTYFYQSRLKNIHDAFSDIKGYLLNVKYYTLIYFVIHFKDEFSDSIGSDYSKVMFLICEYLREIIKTRVQDSLTFQMEGNNIISILYFNEDSLNVLDLIGLIVEKLESEKEFVYVTVASGSVYRDISSLNKAYNEVLDMVKNSRTVDKTQIISVNDLCGLSNRFYFSEEQEKLFINHLSNGNTSECLKLIEHILDINFKKDVRLKYFRNLGIYIVNICIKVCNTSGISIPNSMNIDNIFNTIENTFTIYGFKTLLCKLLKETAPSIAQSRNSDDYIKDYVVYYINKHYSEDIHLDLIAENLNITGSYLSQYFKMKTGKNFSEYLNDVRLEKAKEMMNTTSWHLDEISRKIGYISTNSFIRAFKRTYGITPGDYRRKKNSVMIEIVREIPNHYN